MKLDGKTLTRCVRPYTVTYGGESVVVDQPGWWPEGDGDGVFVGEDNEVWSEALRRLKAKVAARAASTTAAE